MVLVVDPGENSLSRYRQHRRFHAADGRPGGAGQRSGGGGADTILAVPPGTVVSDVATGDVLGDLVAPGQRLVVAAGGPGGRGNARFATPTRQAPRIGELGASGEQRSIRLELKLIADVGLVGLPNAGKSTLLAALTGARPKIADYPFTTLHPNLGVAEVEGGRVLVLADVPGLIEGAHRGAGLGTEFLRHLDRTRVLVHLVDPTPGAAAARRALRQVEEELAGFSPGLAARPTVVALTKMDLPGAERAARDLERAIPGAVRISGVTGAGLPELLAELSAMVAATLAEGVAEVPPSGPAGGHRLYRHTPRAPETPRVTRDAAGAYVVTGSAVERMVERTDLAEDEAVVALQRRLRAAGVDAALAAAGCREGDTVRIAGAEFAYADPDAPAPGEGAARRRRRPRAPLRSA